MDTPVIDLMESAKGEWEAATRPYVDRYKLSMLEDYWAASRAYFQAMSAWMSDKSEVNASAYRAAAVRIDEVNDALVKLIGAVPKQPETLNG